MPYSASFQSIRSAALAQAGAVIVLGAGLLAMAYTQPAWLGDRIGPGLFAQHLAKGVLLLGAAMALVALRRPASVDGRPRTARIWAGLAILGGVALFAAFARDAGLVACCAAAAALTGWAAGERGAAALLRAAGVGAGAAVAIGYSLLPEAAPLWP
jgi:hypothetical protein